MANSVELADFLTEAAKHFDFLLAAGFVPNVSEGHRLLYSSAQLDVEVLYDDRDGRVLTLVAGSVGARNPRANLICLFVEAGLGPAQAISEIARTKKRLAPVLDSHAAALRALLSRLSGPDGADLLIACHGT